MGPEDDHQEPLNHRGEYLVTRNRIATAQYECFQRIVKESHRKTKTAGETLKSATLLVSLLSLSALTQQLTVLACCR